VPAAGRRLALRVTRDAERQLRAGHPWLFADSITPAPDAGTAAAGDLAVVFDRQRRFLAIGLYDPGSPLRVRVLHAGRPRPIDRSFWRERLQEALARRGPLVDSVGTTAYRWVHGENDRLPGLVLDRYASTVVCKLYSAAWFPHLRDVLAEVAAIARPERVVLRMSRAVRNGPTFGLEEGMVLSGAGPGGPVRFRENGWLFEADVQHGQKTGHFLDQRDNRRLTGRYTAGARVLDVFCCTGGFTVASAAGGATLVHSVDQSTAALATTRRNLAANGDVPRVAACTHRQTAGDAFEVLERLAASADRYDVVVIDPPSFAPRQANVPAALRAYGRLTDLGLALLEGGGLLVQASCSARVSSAEFLSVVRNRAGRAGVALDELAVTGHPLDHPIGFPQGAYLKALFARRR
jgi:23S rRNA (cytosine1962-C5)-methyltransferase